METCGLEGHLLGPLPLFTGLMVQMNNELVRAGGEAGVPSAERMFQEMHALINMLRCQTFSNPGSGTGFDLAIYSGPTLLWSGSYDSTICARL